MKKLINELSELEVVSRHRGGRVEVVNERGEMRVVNENDLERVESFSISASAWIREMTRARLLELREARLKL